MHNGANISTLATTANKQVSATTGRQFVSAWPAQLLMRSRNKAMRMIGGGSDFIWGIFFFFFLC